MAERQPEADQGQPYKYRALESPLHIRLIHILPGKPDEDIRLRISHELLKKPEQPRSLRLSRRHLQRTLPPGWEVVETIEGRFIFMSEPDDTSNGEEDESEESDEGNGIIHNWEHPDPTVDPALYELPPLNPSQPAFEALSYAWGGQSEPVVATVQGEAGESLGNIKLGKNLATALRHLRYQDKERVLWVDAICINQNDDVERATQVLRMSNIYQDCSRVIIWLGPEKHGIGLLFSELAHIGSQIEKTTNGLIMSTPDTTDFSWWQSDVSVSFSDEVWPAMKKLGDRSWFHRLWTVQEAIMANRDSIVQSGDASISWSLFRRAVTCLLHKDEMPMARHSISVMRSVAITRSEQHWHILWTHTKPGCVQTLTTRYTDYWLFYHRGLRVRSSRIMSNPSTSYTSPAFWLVPRLLAAGSCVAVPEVRMRILAPPGFPIFPKQIHMAAEYQTIMPRDVLLTL